MKYLFFFFIFATLSFGRAFSILHIDTPVVPFFVTEIFIFISLVWLMLNPQKIRYINESGVSKSFLYPLAIFFLFGYLKLIFGSFANNPFVFRDIVLCFYILFLPLSYVFMDNLKQLKLFIGILILSNITAILIGWIFFLNIYPHNAIVRFILMTKLFNLGLCYGVTIAFLVPVYLSLKNNLKKLFIMSMLLMNAYMLFISAERTLWVAGVSLFMFFCLMYGKRFLKLVIYFSLILSVMLCVSIYSDVARIKNGYFDSIRGKSRSLVLFLSGKLQWGKERVDQYLTYQFKDSTDKEGGDRIDNQVKSGMDNIVWRLIVWKHSIKFGSTSLLFGKGFGVYPDYKIWGYQKPLKIGIDSKVIPAHNHLITIFYKMGLFGLVLFLWVNTYVFLYGLRYVNKVENGFVKDFLIGTLGAFLFWHVMALFFDVIDSPPTSIFIWVLMGVIFAVVEIDKKSKSRNLQEA